MSTQIPSILMESIVIAFPLSRIVSIAFLSVSWFRTCSEILEYPRSPELFTFSACAPNMTAAHCCSGANKISIFYLCFFKWKTRTVYEDLNRSQHHKAT